MDNTRVPSVGRQQIVKESSGSASSPGRRDSRGAGHPRDHGTSKEQSGGGYAGATSEREKDLGTYNELAYSSTSLIDLLLARFRNHNLL